MAVSRLRGDGGTLAAMESSEPQSPPARLTLISHAATLAVKRASFPLDEPVIDEEMQKVEAIAWTAPRTHQICCGPEKRVQQTAKALGLDWTVTSEIADVNYGIWSGKGIEEVHALDPIGLAAWLTDVEAAPHGGESFRQVIERIGNWMENQTRAGHTLAVTHPAVVRAAILYAMQAPPSSFWRLEIAPLSITDLRYNGRLWTVRSTGSALYKT